MMVVNKSSSDIDKVLSLERRKCQWTWCEWRWCFESKEKIGFKKFRFWSRSSAAAPLLNRRTSSFQQVERRKRWHFWLFCTWVGWLLPLSLSSSLPWPATAAPCHHVTTVVRRWHILAYNYNVCCCNCKSTTSKTLLKLSTYILPQSWRIESNMYYTCVLEMIEEDYTARSHFLRFGPQEGGYIMKHVFIRFGSSYSKVWLSMIYSCHSKGISMKRRRKTIITTP